MNTKVGNENINDFHSVKFTFLSPDIDTVSHVPLLTTFLMHILGKMCVFFPF